MWDMRGSNRMERLWGGGGWGGEKFSAQKVRPGVYMTGCKVQFGSKLMRANMEEMKMSKFVGINVVIP